MNQVDAVHSQVFLFVNKDQQSRSLSRSDGNTAKEINRHAQNVRNRRLEAQRASAARQSSSVARRIALGGWKHRSPGSPTSDPPTTPATPITPISPFLDSSPTSEDASTPMSTMILPIHHHPGVILETTQHGDMPENQENRKSKSLSMDDYRNENIRSCMTLPSPNSIHRANFSATDCVDPFGQTNVKITGQLHSLLQHTLRIYAYAGNNYKLAFLPHHIRSSISQFPIQTVVQRSVFKEHHLYSLLACITTRMKHQFNTSGDCDRPEQFRATASHHLRKELIRSSETGQVDTQIILDILFIAVSEMGSGQYDSARKHLEVVDRLYHLLDTTSHFDHWISESAAHVDNQLAISTNKPPVLKQNFDPGPLLPERMATLKREVKNLQSQTKTPVMVVPNPRTSVVPSAPGGFRDAIADIASTFDLRMGTKFEMGLKLGVFDERMGKVVCDLVDCVTVAKVVWLSPLAVCFDAEWLCRKARSVLRALLNLAPENHGGPLDMIGKCMESARLSLMIMMAHACTLIGYQTAKANTERLQCSMEWALKFWCPMVGWDEECKPISDRPLEHFTFTQAGFILWSLMIGIFAAGDTSISEWFMVRACNICRNIGIHTFEDLQNHMRYYLYAKTLQEESVHRVTKRLKANF